MKKEEDSTFELFWAKTIGQKSEPELFMKGYIKEMCRESYKKGYDNALDDNNILYGEDAKKFLEETGL